MDEEIPSPSVWYTYRFPLFLGGISIVCIVISFVLTIHSFQQVAPIEFSSNQSSPSAHREKTIVIDIEGAVVHPGVYTLSEGARIEDAIQSAGGLSATADQKQIGKTINKASLLLDGAKLYIPGEGESSSRMTDTSSHLSPFVSLNTATEKELDTLPGIGEVTAKKIIAGRPYQTLDELVARKIVTQSVFEKIKSQLAL